MGNIVHDSLLLQRAERINVNTTSSEGLVEDKKSSVPYQETEKLLDKEEAKEIVQSMNEFLEPAQTELKFEFHDKLEEYYVTLVNPETDEVIKEIPPKKLLDIYASMAEFLGFLVDRKV
ncbi:MULTISPECIES: flagellar protein FlaG [Pontibacillus]|uniref:Flagellar protein FlaG n=1 Tax=Pontibacillus chungwhensis TaxID=265426 RepID=A0ABY8UYZ0_9BACI|nr:flagellar protein FlaG [Pontibacillus chungwhensis]WIF97615.1 flagellar protein FlaG [Pontibacillus chungwhensis]